MRHPERITRGGQVDPVTGKLKRKKYFRWQVVIPVAPGKKSYKLFATKDEAAAYCATLEVERKGGDVLIPKKMTFGTATDRVNLLSKKPEPVDWSVQPKSNDALREFYKSQFVGQRARTVRGYEKLLRRLLRHFGGRLVRSITDTDCERFRDEELAAIRGRERVRCARSLTVARRKLDWAQKAQGWSEAPALGPYERRVQELEVRATTVDRRGATDVGKAVAMLGRFLAWAQGKHYVTVNVTGSVKKPRVQRRIDRTDEENVYAPREIELLLAAAEPGLARTALGVLAYGGLRIGELRALTWGNFSAVAGTVRVERAADDKGKIDAPKTTKGARTIELPGFLVRQLKEWRLQCPPSGQDLMFPDSAGGVLDDNNFRKRHYQRAQRRAGLRGIELHKLRHTAGSLWIAAGCDLQTVSTKMGHANLSITLSVYAHDFKRSSVASVATKLEAFLKAEKAADCEMTANPPTAA